MEAKIMLFRIQPGRIRAIAIAVGLAIVLFVGMVTVIFAQGSVITACVHDNNGNVRIVNSANDCKKQERVLQWGSSGQGSAGPQGPVGPPGPAGVSGYQVVRVDYLLPAGGLLRNSAACPSGKVVLSGGASVVDGSPAAHTVLQESAPGTVGNPAQSAWIAAMQNNDSVQHTIGIFAVCATITQ
jgi:hypothetical protein